VRENIDKKEVEKEIAKLNKDKNLRQLTSFKKEPFKWQNKRHACL
jgi:hypothetical protein